MENTTINRVKEVIIMTMDGSSVNAVINSRICMDKEYSCSPAALVVTVTAGRDRSAASAFKLHPNRVMNITKELNFLTAFPPLLWKAPLFGYYFWQICWQSPPEAGMKKFRKTRISNLPLLPEEIILSEE